MLPLWDLKQRQATTTQMQVAGTYDAGDVVEGRFPWNVKNDESDEARGFISDVKLLDAGNKSAAFELWLFDAVPVNIADDALFRPTLANMKNLIGKVDIAAGDYTSQVLSTGGTVAWAHVESLEKRFAAADGTLIYGYLVDAAGAYQPAAATDLSLSIGFYHT